MRILLTGALGLIGQSVYEKANRTHTIYRTDTKRIEGLENYICCDLSDDSTLDQLDNLNIDAVVHCAAVFPKSFSGDEAQYSGTLNRKIDDNIIHYVMKQNAKLVFVSSISVYGDMHGSKVDERTEVELDNNIYSKNKIMSEQIICSKLKDYSIIRISSPYGIHQTTQNVLKIFIDNILLGKELIYFGKGSRTQNFVYADDVAEAICKILEKAAKGIFNIAGEEISMKHLADACANTAKKFGKEVQVNKGNCIDPQENVRVLVDISKAKKELLWYPRTSIEEGIYRCLDVRQKKEKP